MNDRVETNRILDAYLAPGADRLPDRVIDAALADIARTPQRRAPRVPWRFLVMTNTTRAAVAGVAIVAIVGLGLVAFNARGTGAGGVGSASTASPSLKSPPPTPGSPAPTQVAPGIMYWNGYTSHAYNMIFGYPDDWTLDHAATRAWRRGDQAKDSSLYSEGFMNPESRDGDQIALGVWQMTPGSAADVTSREGLAAWFEAHLCDDHIEKCETVPDVAVPMCVGKTACRPAILVPLSDSTQAILGGDIGPKDGQITIVSLGRANAFPAAARYGGSVQLLKSILTTMDVWTPQSGQVPVGT
jgi:hypothetical protein